MSAMPLSGRLPVFFAQEDYLLRREYAPVKADAPFSADTVMALHIAGPVTPSDIGAALSELTRSHPALRAVFSPTVPVGSAERQRLLRSPLLYVDACESDLFTQYIGDPSPCAVTLRPQTTLDCDAPCVPSDVRTFLLSSRDHNTPAFDRAVVCPLLPDDHLTYLAVPHLRVDGFSRGLIASDLAARLAWRNGAVATDGPPRSDYHDAAHSERDWLQGKSSSQSAEYWSQAAAKSRRVHFSTSDLPFCLPWLASAGGQYSMGVTQEWLAPDVAARLQSEHSDTGIMRNVLCLGAALLVLHYYTARYDLALWHHFDVRSEAERALVANREHLHPIVCHVDPGMDLTAWLHEMSASYLEARSHARVPDYWVRRRGHACLGHVRCGCDVRVLSAAGLATSAGSIRVSELPGTHQRDGELTLHFELQLHTDRTLAVLSYCTDLIPPHAANTLLRSFTMLLDTVSHDAGCGRRVGTVVDVLSPIPSLCKDVLARSNASSL